MKNLRPYVKLFPEIYFLASVLFYWFFTATLFNPVAIALFFLLILQLIYQNKIAGITTAGIFMMINMYMILALLSEFYEFPAINSEAKALLLVGILYFGLNLIMSAVMGIKYIKQAAEDRMIGA